MQDKARYHPVQLIPFDLILFLAKDGLQERELASVGSRQDTGCVLHSYLERYVEGHCVCRNRGIEKCVIYLKKDSTVAKPSLTKEMPNGRAVHRFDFDVIRLWEIPTRELKQKKLDGLLPLLPLTREGAQRKVVEEAITGLTPAGQEPKAELLVLTYGLASLALENEADQEWLDRRFSMLYDILRETRAFRELTKDSRQEGIEEGRKEGIEEGRKEGRKEGIEEGKVEGLREALLTLVQARFSNPKIARLAKGQASIIDDPAVLQDLIVKVGLARTLEEAQQYLLDWPTSDNENN